MGNYRLLDSIHDPRDLRSKSTEELLQVCIELREFIIETVLTNGGHFSANLGVIELTVALHYVFDTPHDRLVWDVGHQAYPHKVLTGRMQHLSQIRKKGGISGFPSRMESTYDHFGTGHSSTSISAVLGMAIAHGLRNERNSHIAVIGDGSLSAGQAFEALNHAGGTEADILIVVNDNHMAIDPGTGALHEHLHNIGNQNPNYFQNLGLQYFGPIDGHDLPGLIKILGELRENRTPRVLHVRTVKGKGYPEAEVEQTKWHATTSFVKLEQHLPTTGIKYQDVFGLTMLDLARMREDVVAITPAMPTGCGLTHMMAEFSHRVFDVGIAEQHAVTFAAGLAAEGYRPFCNLYATFLQRSYDQIIHDVCLQKLPVIICIDRAGVVGEDGPTHHGMFDLICLLPVPNLVIACPSSAVELRNLMFTAMLHLSGPFAIRYPKENSQEEDWRRQTERIEIGKGLSIQKGQKVALIGLGYGFVILEKVAGLLVQNGLNPTLIDARFAKPIDTAWYSEVFDNHEYAFTLEDGAVLGGFGQHLKSEFSVLKCHVVHFGFPDEFIPHATRSELFQMYALDADSIAKHILKTIS